MTRQINAAALLHIKNSEGLRLNAYPDPGSSNGEPWTIGYGSTKGVRKGMKITEAEAEARLIDDLAGAENAVSKLVTVPLNDNQFGALASLVFNIGATAFAGSTLLRKLNAEDYAAVPAQIKRWDKNDGKVMPGLTKRRAAESALWSKSVDPLPPIDVTPTSSIPTQTLPEPVKGRGAVGWLSLALIVVAAVVYFVFIKRG